jgi:hypothetical protein
VRELLDPGGGAGQTVRQVLCLPPQVQGHLPGLSRPHHEVILISVIIVVDPDLDRIGCP